MAEEGDVWEVCEEFCGILSRRNNLDLYLDLNDGKRQVFASDSVDHGRGRGGQPACRGRAAGPWWLSNDPVDHAGGPNSWWPRTTARWKDPDTGRWEGRTQTPVASPARRPHAPSRASWLP